MNTFVEVVLVYGTLHPSSWPHSIDKDLLRILQMTDDGIHLLDKIELLVLSSVIF